MPHHFDTFQLQDEQLYFSEIIKDKDEYVKMVCQDGDAFAVVCHGETMCIAGLVKVWDGRSILWSLMSRNVGKNMWFIVKAARNLIDLFGEKRVEATVDCDFKNGHRFMRLLGFRCEAERMVGFEPGDRDCSLYARIK